MRNMQSKIVMRTALAIFLGAGGITAHAQTQYNVALMSDFSGPYADIMPFLAKSREAVIDWWNAEIGTKHGVKINYKNYDTRYDPAQVASLWPGVKSELSPIAVMGIGGPDAAALSERLQQDKIPLFQGTATYGYIWKPNSWVFFARPTYAHESAAAMEWLRARRGGSEPLKVAMLGSEATPAYVDIPKGLAKYAEDHPQSVQVTEILYTDVQPVDLTTQTRRLLSKGTETFYIATNTAQVVAVKRALQAFGSKAPIVVSSHNGLIASGKALGDPKQMEGDYEVYAMALPTDEDTPAKRFYEKLKAEYGLNIPWNILTVMGMSQGLYTIRAIEHAIERYGATGLTGEKVRQALFEREITTEETFTFLPNLKYTEDAPFPTSGLTVNIGTLKDGKLVSAARGVPVPVLNKW